MMRRFGDVPVRGQRYQIRHGVYAILPKGRELLVTYQAGEHREFQLPGGGVDAGEHPLEALHREVFEETGWKIANAVRLGAYRRFAYLPEYEMWAEKLCTIYAALPIRPLGPPGEAEHTAVIMSPDVALKKLANSGDRHFVAQAFGAF